eukprot:m.44574 g.44574  ORF g.44574 m.44574 type:complete len:186 (+) comp10840_c0_seq1:141-698(+)
MSTRALPKPPSKIAGGSARVATQRRQYHNAAVKFSPKATKAETMRGTAAFEDMMGSGGFDGMGDDIELDVRDVQDADMELVRSLPQRPVDKVSESSQADGVVPLTERLHRDRRDRHFAAVQKLRSDMGSINTEVGICLVLRTCTEVVAIHESQLFSRCCFPSFFPSKSCLCAPALLLLSPPLTLS